MTKTPTTNKEDKEIVRRRDEAVRRALNTPPKPHSEMKLGKKKRKPSAPVSKKA